MISGNDVPAHMYIKKNTNMPEAQNCVICVQKKYAYIPIINMNLQSILQWSETSTLKPLRQNDETLWDTVFDYMNTVTARFFFKTVADRKTKNRRNDTLHASVFSSFFFIWSHYSCRGAQRVPLPARIPPAGEQLGGGRKILNLFCWKCNFSL